jgi:hypothetical protein
MKQSQTERALIGTDARGSPIVLATDGPWIAADVENICSGAEDIGLVDARDLKEPGLYLWQGFGQIGLVSWDSNEVETEYIGMLRPVKPEEVAELYRMRPPEPPEEKSPDGPPPETR